MKTGKMLLMLGLICGLGMFGTGCDELEEAIDGEAVPHKEADLPNCSRVVACCNNALLQSVAPGEVNEQCSMVFVPATNTVIDTYQDTRKTIEDGLSEDGETVDALRTRTQDTFEPGCRCFLEETVGKLGAANLPLDCEVIETSGSLDDGATCTDAIDVLTDEN